VKLEAQTVTGILADLLRETFRVRCERDKTFPWLRCKGRLIVATAYFGPPLHCLFQFDSAVHFNRDRLRTLDGYPDAAPLGFDFARYQNLCQASRRRSSAQTRRRASEDALLDLLPPKHGLNPTLRLAEAEIREKVVGRLTAARSRAALETLLEKRFSVHAGTTFLQLLEHPSGKPFVPRFGAR
jgi:hypothetical protein